MRQYYVYILTNKRHTVLYTGVTNDAEIRTWQHKNKVVNGFTKKYNVDKIVFTELFNRVEDAIAVEKKIKGWTRAKKVALIESMNHEWKDLLVSF